jgi:hypothetical protein
MTKRGRKGAPLPRGVRKIERRRHGVRIWLEGAPDDPPTAELKLRASKRPVGRPLQSVEQAKKLLDLRIRTAIREAQADSLKVALYGAMRALNWPDQSPAEHKRLAERFRVRSRSASPSLPRTARIYSIGISGEIFWIYSFDIGLVLVELCVL